MATFPALSSAAAHYRTWRWQASQTIAVQGTVALTNGRGLRLAKEAMIGNGSWTDNTGAASTSSGNWSVVSSSDGAGGFGNNDNNDRWAADGNVVWANSGTNHSWTVLKQTGITGTYYLCIDCVGTNTYLAAFIWSKNLFTGGTATARPTSSGEAICGVPGTTVPWGGPISNVQTIMHVMKSTDGKATRIVWARNNFSTGFWLADELEYAPPGVTGPAVFYAYGDQTAATAASIMIQNYFGNPGNTSGVVQVNGNPAPCVFNNFFSNNAAVSFVTSPTVQNDMAAAWPAYRVKVLTPYNVVANGVSTVPITSARGEQGIVRDLWWIPSVIGETDMAPSGGGKNFVCWGDLCLPWNTSVPTMA